MTLSRSNLHLPSNTPNNACLQLLILGQGIIQLHLARGQNIENIGGGGPLVKKNILPLNYMVNILSLLT